VFFFFFLGDEYIFILKTFNQEGINTSHI